jgi:muramoyltetrapeptide carboxypeptidase
LVFGDFTRCQEPAGRPSATVEQVIAEHAARAGVPAVGGLPLGHGPGQLTVPHGAAAVLDADAGTLAFAAAATRP